MIRLSGTMQAVINSIADMTQESLQPLYKTDMNSDLFGRSVQQFSSVMRIIMYLVRVRVESELGVNCRDCERKSFGKDCQEHETIDGNLVELRIRGIA